MKDITEKIIIIELAVRVEANYNHSDYAMNIVPSRGHYVMGVDLNFTPYRCEIIGRCLRNDPSKN